YKETAFAHAIASASVAISIARGCSSGTLLNCGCDSKTYKMRKPRSMSRSMFQTSWKWGGCSHNLHYGTKFSKLFLDSRERAEDIHSKINLHNNQVGRMTNITDSPGDINGLVALFCSPWAILLFVRPEGAGHPNDRPKIRAQL
ncbi:hypothetical protein NQ315_004958, partial [Exocentrus adspersus]